MRIAVCLFGKTGKYSKNKINKYLDPEESYKNYEDVIFKNYNLDFFFHTWEDENNKFTKKLINLYNPKSYIIQKQIDFSKYTISNYSLEHINSYKRIFTLTDNVYNFLHNNYIFNSHSRWYSNSEAIKLMQDYSDKNLIKYDWVLQLRFDLFFRQSFPFEKLQNDYFYCCPRFHIDKDIAVNDTWFLSNYENAIKFSKIYDNIFNYSIWTHSAAKQHLDFIKAKINFFPDYNKKIKNYWMMRSVLQEEKLNFINKIFIKILNIINSILLKLLNISEKLKKNLEL